MDRACCRRRQMPIVGGKRRLGFGLSFGSGLGFGGGADSSNSAAPDSDVLPAVDSAGEGSAKRQRCPESNAKGVSDALLDGFRRDDVIRLMLGAFADLGVSKGTLRSIEDEVGVRLESDLVAVLRESVLAADWATAASAVKNLDVDPEDDAEIRICSLRFLLLEQRVLELAATDPSEASTLCKRELETAIHDSVSREKVDHLVRSLAEGGDGQVVARQQTNSEDVWERVIDLLPPRYLVPKRRLSVLLWQAVRYQQLHCFHQDSSKCGAGFPSGLPPPLLRDYSCKPPRLPNRCISRLKAHTDEVWYAATSNDGRFIASSSKDKSVIIWEFTPPAEFRVSCVLREHSGPCSCLAWSPDNRFLLTASCDMTARLWEGTGKSSGFELIRTFKKHTDAVTSVGWLEGSTRFVTAGLDRYIYLWNVDGTELGRWEVSSRVQDMSVTFDGKRILVVDADRCVKVIDVDGQKELLSLPEREAVTSVCASEFRDEVLVNVALQVSTSQQGPLIRLWDLASKRIVQRYLGHYQGRFVVHSCFGGPREEFVFSGSEDSQVYMWHRHHGSLLLVLPGHSATVNSVSWAKSSAWLVSASDDHTLRIWSASNIPAIAEDTEEEETEDNEAMDVDEDVDLESHHETEVRPLLPPRELLQAPLLPSRTPGTAIVLRPRLPGFWDHLRLVRPPVPGLRPSTNFGTGLEEPATDLTEDGGESERADSETPDVLGVTEIPGEVRGEENRDIDDEE